MEESAWLVAGVSRSMGGGNAGLNTQGRQKRLQKRGGFSLFCSAIPQRLHDTRCRYLVAPPI